MAFSRSIKGVVLAGGRGTRLWPITKVVSKHLLPVAGKPIIHYPIETLRNAGIKDILVICGSEHTDQYVRVLGSGRELGVRISYAIQQKPIGIAQGLGLAKGFAQDSKVALILGDNLFGDNFSKEVEDFRKASAGARIVLKKVHDPERFGVARFSRDGKKISEIIEKPKNPPSNWAVTGFYLYDNRVFDVIKTLKPSARGEYEITDVNNWYVRNGSMSFIKAKKHWLDVGTFPSLHKANVLLSK